MIDARRIELRSIEELILALHPVQSSAMNSDRPALTLSEWRLIKSNISAVLSFTSFSLGKQRPHDPEFQRVIEEVRRECLLINGMISRVIFRQRWLFSVSKVEDARIVLAHYQHMASTACRMCLLFAPELGDHLLSAF